MAKETQVQVRLTHEEKARLSERARGYGLSVSAYLRLAAGLEASPAPLPVEPEIVGQTLSPQAEARVPDRPTIQRDPYSFPASSGKRSFRPDPK